jgi:hypothetical protein
MFIILLLLLCMLFLVGGGINFTIIRSMRTLQDENTKLWPAALSLLRCPSGFQLEVNARR